MMTMLINCPHCGNVRRPTGDEDSGVGEDLWEEECPACEKLFSVFREELFMFDTTIGGAEKKKKAP